MYCIYKITNLINGKTYIGQHKYKKLDDNYMGSGKILKQDIKKHGIENFKKEILYSRIQYKETADDMERFAIAKERAIGKAEYNLADGGQGGNLGEEVNKKISDAKKGENHHFYGKHLSEEHKKKMSESRKGEKNGFYGKHHSEEAKKKMSESHKEQVPWNKEKKGLQTAWNKGKNLSEETKKKMSESMKGFHHSEETKKKISETLKGHHGYWQGKTAWNKGKPMPEEQKKRMEEVREAYKKSGRKDWNTFQKEYRNK